MTAPALFLLVVLVAEMVFFAMAAPRLRRRFGLIGLGAGGLVTWYAFLFVFGVAKRLGAPELDGKIGMLEIFALLAGLIGVVVICIGTVRESRSVSEGQPGYSSTKSASQALAIGVGVVIILAFGALFLISQMAP